MNKDTLIEQLELAEKHHMQINWTEFTKSPTQTPITNSTLVDQSGIVGRIGIMLLSCGTGAWRVRESMDVIASSLGIKCSADIGLTSIEYTCFTENNLSYSQTLSLPATGVNMTKLTKLEQFVTEFPTKVKQLTIGEVHQTLDEINHERSLYPASIAGLASGLACGGFIFLLGGGIIEVICAFIGAGIGNFTRAYMGKKQLTLFAKISCSVMIACLMYFLAFSIINSIFHVGTVHTRGYIGAMLFVIPGFPFITSGLDMSKLDMRSGLERLAHAIQIVVIATTFAWGAATICQIHPGDFPKLGLDPITLTGLRLIASFCGVFGFSLMFNSRPKLAATAGVLGAIANTLRLSLVQFLLIPGGFAAFIGALLSGLLASLVRKKTGFPRIAITVPSIVIMVPGLYLYRGIFYLGLSQFENGLGWVIQALLIIIALPFGLITARILTDKKWRHIG
ncbi:MAG: threonine/serine exporter family protein [Lactobacillus sp.]|nr:threonine/serine exporter family protein [Lactobacillus sp.]